MMESGAVKPVGFVKKERKGNFRRKEKVADDDEGEDSEAVRKSILETRLEHKVTVHRRACACAGFAALCMRVCTGVRACTQERLWRGQEQHVLALGWGRWAGSAGCGVRRRGVERGLSAKEGGDGFDRPF